MKATAGFIIATGIYFAVAAYGGSKDAGFLAFACGLLAGNITASIRSKNHDR